MFNIFKELKQLKMTKQELEQQNADLLAALDRANAANRDLNESYKVIANELNLAIKKIQELAEQLKMKDAQRKAETKFNDRERNY
jgi:hypothetical protein